MDVGLFLQRYQSGKRDFAWADLQGADLAQVDLADINLYRANLAQANLQGANLRSANLFKANLAGANLQSANLSDANLRKANLTDANLDNARLQAAELAGAILPDGTRHERFPQENQRSPQTVESPVKYQTERTLQTALSDLEGMDINNVAIRPDSRDDSTSSKPPASLLTTASALRGSLATVAVGYACYGVILTQIQAPFWAFLLVFGTLFCGSLQLKSVWTVPILSAMAIVLSSGLELGSLIFSTLASLGILMALGFYGSIVGRPLGKTLQDSVWFGGLSFLAIAIAPWIADGSRAYSGGGIVLKLDTFHLAALLVVGMSCVGIGCLFLAREESFYRSSAQKSNNNKWRFLEFGIAGGIGLGAGLLLGGM